MRLSRLTIPILALLLCVGCGAKGYHIATVSVATAHTSLKAAQDVALKGKCGEPTAPPAPICLSNVAPAEGQDSPNVKVHKALTKGFEIDGKVAAAVRDWPIGTPMPAEVPGYLAQITQLLTDVVGTFPDGALKTRLLDLLGGK